MRRAHVVCADVAADALAATTIGISGAALMKVFAYLHAIDQRIDRCSNIGGVESNVRRANSVGIYPDFRDKSSENRPGNVRSWRYNGPRIAVRECRKLAELRLNQKPLVVAVS